MSEYPTPIVDRPDLRELVEAQGDGVCQTSDGCWVEADGTCEHGHPSWLVRLGLI